MRIEDRQTFMMENFVRMVNCLFFAFSYFRKKLHHKCLTRSQIDLWSFKATKIEMISMMV